MSKIYNNNNNTIQDLPKVVSLNGVQTVASRLSDDELTQAGYFNNK